MKSKLKELFQAKIGLNKKAQKIHEPAHILNGGDIDKDLKRSPPLPH
ncbi:hypothetical protein [Acidiplasma aeolicum]|jgi:hypothetical protein